MPIVNGMNSDIIEYFSLEDYIDRIVLLPDTLEHLQDTSSNFKDYLKKLFSYDETYILDYWIYLLYEELKSTKKIENIDFSKINLMDDEIFFNKMAISHHRIHELHNFIAAEDNEPSFCYRKCEVDVSRFNSNNEKEIFWRGVQAKDVERFMDDFLKIYKRNDISITMNHPFIKSALVHLLFLRIHPYIDGNGRTARMLHNLKFTELINDIYKTNLRISPLPLSKSLLINKITYVKATDNIYFDLKHDTNDAINNWFNMILNMTDEQIYFASHKLEEIDPEHLKDIQQNVQGEGRPSTGKMRIRELKK